MGFVIQVSGTVLGGRAVRFFGGCESRRARGCILISFTLKYNWVQEWAVRASFPSIESANPGVLGQYAQRSKHFDFDFDWRSTQPLQVSQYIIIRTFLQCCALCGIFSASFSGVKTIFRCMAFSLFLYRMHIKIHNIYANLACGGCRSTYGASCRKHRLLCLHRESGIRQVTTMRKPSF